jgi:hypothetical protein
MKGRSERVGMESKGNDGRVGKGWNWNRGCGHVFGRSVSLTALL